MELKKQVEKLIFPLFFVPVSLAVGLYLLPVFFFHFSMLKSQF